MISDELFEKCLRAVHLAPPDKPTLALLLDMATVQVDAFTAALEIAFAAGRESAGQLVEADTVTRFEFQIWWDGGETVTYDSYGGDEDTVKEKARRFLNASGADARRSEARSYVQHTYRVDEKVLSRFGDWGDVDA